MDQRYVTSVFFCLRADRLLLKDEENLKCFTRTQHDFTCFFETPDNRTYDLFYRVSGYVRRGCMCAWSHLTGRQIIETVLFPRDLAGPKGVNCLCRRPKRERSSTSAHFLPWMFSCTWKCSWRLWSVAPTPTCTHGPSVWKITVRIVLLRSNTLNIFYTSHFLCSRCCHSKRWLLFRFAGGRKIDPSVLWVFICPPINPSEAVSCL